MSEKEAQAAKPAPKAMKVAVVGTFLIVFAIFAGIYCLIGSFLHDGNSVNRLVLSPAVGANRFYNLDLVPGAKKEVIDIATPDGNKLNAWLFKVPGSDKLTIVSHGNAGNISNRIYLANVLVPAGSSVLVYDYRGYGLSTGTPSIQGILQDGLTAYDYAHKQLGYPPDKILLYGESIGSAVTCNLACERSCAAVILQSGIASLPAAGRFVFPFLWLYPDFIFATPHLDNVQRVKDIHVPILLIHGKVDHIVAFQSSEKMFAAANEPKQLVFLPHCGHNDMGVQDTKLFYDAISHFVFQVK
jgi:fermentation-respiration switch protein FrsA (DUF1100 family)